MARETRVALRKRVVGGDPAGWPQVLVCLGGSVICLCLYGYSLLEGDGGVSVAPLFAVAFGSMGVAELPTSPRWLTSALRLVALGIWIALLLLTLLDPTVLWGS